MKIKGIELTGLFNVMKQLDYMGDESWFKIDKEEEGLEYLFNNEDYYYEDVTHLIEPLHGYKLKIKQKGEHYNDSQIVEYILKFKSPEGVITKVSTTRTLMMGFQDPEDIILK